LESTMDLDVQYSVYWTKLLEQRVQCSPRCLCLQILL
jgi:hypothetical protein